MLVTTFLALIMVLAAAVAPVFILMGIWLLLLNVLTKRKQWKRGAKFLLAGVLCIVINPVAWQMIDGVVQSVSAGYSGARWISYNAPGSGFIWNGTKFIKLEITHPWIDGDKEQKMHVMQPKSNGETINIKDYVFPDWVYPVENDGGFVLYVYDNYLYCPEEQMDAALEYFQDYDDWDSIN